MRKKRDEERQKQLRWREEHRIALLQGNVPPRDAVDTLSIVDPYGVRRDSSRTTGAGGPGGAFGTGGRNDAGAQAYRQKQWRRVGIFAAGVGRLKMQVHANGTYL
jgi:hypothetical protein